jgi:acetyl esterase/lipase
MKSPFGESTSWRLWPESPGIPPDAPDFVSQNDDSAIPDILDVNRPRVFAFTPDKPVGRAALVLAGGGYTKLVASYEGVDVARWLVSIGYHAFLLVHRFPQARWASGAFNGSQAPLDDAIEAMRQIRTRAAEFGIQKLGVVGLSSGGHLAAALCANYPATWSAPESKHAAHGARPDFLVIGYAPISTNATGRTVIANKPPLPPPEKQAMYEVLQPDAQLAHAPPAFLVYSAEDAVVPVENAWRLGAALRARGAKVEAHIYAKGPHGFALRSEILPLVHWPKLCAVWLSNLA